MSSVANTNEMTKAQAQRWLAKLIERQGVNDSAHLVRSQSPVATFGSAARQWRDQHLLKNKKRSSQSSMTCELNKHVLPKLEDTLLEYITYPLIRELIQTWQAQGLSRKTIKNLFGHIRTVYNFHLDETAESGRPAFPPWIIKWRKVAPVKTVQREEPHFTPQQMASIVATAKKKNHRALFALAASTGARAGELFALRVESDLNLTEQNITIRRSVFDGQENTSKSDTGDEDRTRTVPIDALVAQELARHLDGRKFGYVFQTRNGTPLRLSNVLRDQLYPVLRKLGLIQPGIGMHAFRRGRISQLVYAGVSRQVIRDWCGHSSDKMIDHYTKQLRQHHASEMAKVQSLLDPGWTLVPREESGTPLQAAVN